MAKKRSKSISFHKSKLLSDILSLHVELYKQAIIKTHYLIVISGVVLSFIINEVFKKTFLQESALFRYGVIIVLVGTLLAILFSLSAAELTSKKSRNRLNIFYHAHETGTLNEKNYERYLENLMLSDKEITESYAQEIFELEQVIKKQFDAIRVGTILMILCSIAGGLMILINFFM